MIDVYWNKAQKLILWRMADRVTLRQMCCAARAFTVEAAVPAYDHITIVDARSANEASWAMRDIFELARFLHQVFSENRAKLQILILVEADWKHGEAHLFCAIARMFKNIDVRVFRSEYALLEYANLLPLTPRVNGLFPAETHAMCA